MQEKRHAHKIPRFKGGGVFCFFLGEGGKCRFYFYGREDFSELRRYQKFEFLIPLMVSATFQAKQRAFRFHHTPDACLQPCSYITSAGCGWWRGLSLSPEALNVDN